MTILLYPSAALALVLTAAIFGFFYAWVCSTMWGLDMADSAVAIAAMQAMNASVRNAVFAPAFFGTPVVFMFTAWFALQKKDQTAVWPFAVAGVIYLLGGLALTVLVNVPMNEALAEVHSPLEPGEADAIWEAYSGPWQRWNVVRMLFGPAAGPHTL